MLKIRLQDHKSIVIFGKNRPRTSTTGFTHTNDLKMEDSSNSDWRRISTGLLYNLKYVLINGLMTDLTIRLVNGEDIKEYKVHKLVFQLASEVFERMLNSTFKEGLSSIVEIKDVKPETFQLFLDNLYGQPLIITDLEQAFGLLQLADYYQIYSLKEDVINVCQSTETPDFACFGLEIAEKCEAPILKESKLQYISKNTKKVVECTNFLKVPLEVIKTILEQDKLSIREIDLFKAVRAWIQHNLAEQGESIKEVLIPMLRYSSMSLSEFIDGPIASELFKCNEIASLMSRLFTGNCSVSLPLGFSEAKRININTNQLTLESFPLGRYIGKSDFSISLTTNKRIFLTHFFIYPPLETTGRYEEVIVISLNHQPKKFFNGVVNAVDKIEIKFDEKIQLDENIKYRLYIFASKTTRNVVYLNEKIIKCDNISFQFQADPPGSGDCLPLHSFSFEC